MLAALMAAGSGGCATVSVYEAASVEDVQLSQPQSAMRQATGDLCEFLHDSGWAEGESTFKSLAKLWGGETEIGAKYWRSIDGDKITSAQVVDLVSQHAALVTGRLSRINLLAKDLVAFSLDEEPPRKSDVIEFERVLIYAGQARESFAAALGRADKRSTLTVDTHFILGELDGTLEVARALADELSAARMSGAMASVDISTS